MSANTLFLRMEGPLQAWGGHESKFVIRRTMDAPTKSGVIGMLCAALGVSRNDAPAQWLPRLAELHMAARIDRPGVRWWDYHTVGAGIGVLTAKGIVKITQTTKKIETLITRREYLCDASFLVALRGEPDLIGELASAMRDPVWLPYLGRKCCPPSRPILETAPGKFPDPIAAIASIPWKPRLNSDRDHAPERIECFMDWRGTPDAPEAPDDAVIHYDVPVSFDPPAHIPRFVIRRSLTVGKDGEILIADQPAQTPAPRPPRPRADYRNSAYRKARAARLNEDKGLCVFCKSPASTVQHITYRRAGGNETSDDLRALCRLCHDAVTMLEYGAHMGMDRINPEDPRWRERIIAKRAEIIEFRSLETRRRRLAAEDVE